MTEIGDPEDERALQDLADAVARIAAIVRTRQPGRDAMVAVREEGLRALAASVAQARGFRVFLADGGAETAATAAGRAFDLILMESETDTACWARRIRALPAPLGGAPIIVLGAQRSAAWREEAGEAGVDAFVSEPVAPARLVETIMLLIGIHLAATRREA